MKRWWAVVAKIAVIAVAGLLLSACGGKFSIRNFTGVKAVPVTMERTTSLVPRRAYIRGLPTGDDSYSVGFRDGCQTILGITGSGTLRLLSERIDAERMVSDSMYVRGWHDGDGYCNDRLDWEGH